MTKICGVYTITTSDGRQYIGSSKDIHKRWREHKCTLRHGYNKNPPLQSAWNECNQFTFEILLICSPINLIMYEQRAIDTLKPSLNICRYAGSHRGVMHTPETKVALSAWQSGKNSRWFGMCGEKSQTAKPVKCIENDIRFVSGKAAADWLVKNGKISARQTKISDVCRGKRKSAYGYTWKFD